MSLRLRKSGESETGRRRITWNNRESTDRRSHGMVLASTFCNETQRGSQIRG